MKLVFRSLSITLIFALLLCMSLFAYNRTEYKKTSKRYFMSAKGQDKNPNGSEKAYAVARLDIDYPGEDGKNHNRIDLFGYASVWALGSGGLYKIKATAYMIENSKSKKWWWFIYRGIDADVRLNYDPNNVDLSTKWAKDYFDMVSAKAYLSNSLDEEFEGEAKDFSHGEPDEWICKDEEGNDSHGEDETCIICDTDINE